MQHFATSGVVQKQANVNTTALIALTRFLNQAQVNNQSSYNYYPVQSYGRLADRDNQIVTHEVIPYLAQELKQAVKQENTPRIHVLIRSLGNLGHPQILNVFEPYLEGKVQISDFQRLAMVVALDKLTINYPKLARNVLFKIYQNTGDVHEIRCAAVFQLFRANPQAQMLQRMAEQTNQEPSKVNITKTTLLILILRYAVYKRKQLHIIFIKMTFYIF